MAKQATPHQESPLVLTIANEPNTHGHITPAPVMLSELALRGYINLRGQGNNFAKAINETTGITLPVKPNTTHENGDQVLCWLGPNEWMLITSPDQQNQAVKQLSTALQEQFAAVTDVSSGYTTIMISGIQARTVLAKGCTLDLHPAVFGQKQCAQTLLAKAPVLLRPVTDDQIEVIVRRSFADYLWRWLTDATDEYSPNY